MEIYRADGSEFVLHDIYALHPDWQLAQMSEEELAAVETHFKCSLFDDLDISLDDIFYQITDLTCQKSHLPSAPLQA